MKMKYLWYHSSIDILKIILRNSLEVQDCFNSFHVSFHNFCCRLWQDRDWVYNWDIAYENGKRKDSFATFVRKVRNNSSHA